MRDIYLCQRLPWHGTPLRPVTFTFNAACLLKKVTTYIKGFGLMWRRDRESKLGFPSAKEAPPTVRLPHLVLNSIEQLEQNCVLVN